jgi:L-ascorbate metabolism protein UlaG (beta-lactamase superfamily)
MILLLSVSAILFLATLLFMQQPQFGSRPSGERLERIKRSPHYKDGTFQNLSHTPAFSNGASYFSVMKKFLFSRNPDGTPTATIPSQKTDLLNLDPKKDILVWFGHSSYFLQLDGKKFLVDPVFSGNASPLSFTTKSFKGSNNYTAEEMPMVDYLLITHDHYDHLDHKTILKLKAKAGKVITGLGVGAHFEHWGYADEKVVELDWFETLVLDSTITLHSAPARHFSGRGFKRNTSLWASFVIITPNNRVYIGGDSGYDDHFKKLGDQFGPFDLVILENGQYDDSWKYIHMTPEEVVQAARDLKARQLFPVHWGKFALGNHSWKEPIERVEKEAKKKRMPLLHPMIGEAVVLKDHAERVKWWENL